MDYDAGDDGSADAVPVLMLGTRSDALGEVVTVHLLLHDLDDLRGALKPDAQGRSWRGDRQALQRLMTPEAA